MERTITMMRRLAADEPPVEMLRAVCPYNNTSRGLCTASLSGMPTEGKDKGLCSSENHDDCPIFLSKVLRLLSSGDKGGGRR
jgi:hypothetical protein